MFSWKTVLHSFLLGILTSVIAQAVMEKYERLSSVLIIFGLMLLIQYDRFVVRVLKKSLAVAVAFFKWTGAGIDSLFDRAGSALSSLTKTRVMRGVEWVFGNLLIGLLKLVEGACTLIFSPPVLLIIFLYGIGWVTDYKHKKYQGYYAAEAAQAEKCYCPTPVTSTYVPAARQPAWRQPNVLNVDCDRPSVGYPGRSVLDELETPSIIYPATQTKGRRKGRATKYLQQQVAPPTVADMYRRAYSDGYSETGLSENLR
jgi:hypothetical protein